MFTTTAGVHLLTFIKRASAGYSRVYVSVLEFVLGLFSPVDVVLAPRSTSRDRFLLIQAKEKNRVYIAEAAVAVGRVCGEPTVAAGRFA
jgi:hypothetical protein